MYLWQPSEKSDCAKPSEIALATTRAAAHACRADTDGAAHGALGTNRSLQMTDEQSAAPMHDAEGGAPAGHSGVEREIDATEAATLRRQADVRIKNHVLVATTLGLVPLPLFDLALLVGNQVAMVHGLSGLYRVPFDKLRTRAIVTSLLAGSAPVLTVVGLSSGAKLMPGIGSLLGSGSVAVGGGALTYAVGQVFVQHFEGGGNLFDVDLAAMRRVFARKVKEGEAAAAEAQAEADEQAEAAR
jgi:uncharacterized protein (DUF697 family)